MECVNRRQFANNECLLEALQLVANLFGNIESPNTNVVQLFLEHLKLCKHCKTLFDAKKNPHAQHMMNRLNIRFKQFSSDESFVIDMLL